jgi:hypothetical protein
MDTVYQVRFDAKVFADGRSQDNSRLEAITIVRTVEGRYRIETVVNLGTFKDFDFETFEEAEGKMIYAAGTKGWRIMCKETLVKP